MNKQDYTLKLIEMLIETILNKDKLSEDQFYSELMQISDIANSLRS